MLVIGVLVIGALVIGVLVVGAPRMGSSVLGLPAWAEWSLVRGMVEWSPRVDRSIDTSMTTTNSGRPDRGRDAPERCGRTDPIEVLLDADPWLSAPPLSISRLSAMARRYFCFSMGSEGHVVGSASAKRASTVDSS